MTRVAVAMSGGVDSTTAAGLLLEQGHEVFGLTMLVEGPAGEAAVEAARRAARELGIRHYISDLRRAFDRAVVRPFCRAYAEGKTPNPCVLCNAAVKFGLLLRRAAALGAGNLATGHYARVERPGPGRPWVLRKARDKGKDQSYFLYRLDQDALARALFPLGAMLKSEVSRWASRRGLAASARPESQEICFIPNGDYAGFVAARVPRALRPGPIIGPGGEVLGRHRGLARYTVGQRRGLGLALPRPYYVVSLEAERTAVQVGPKEALGSRRILAEDVHWISGRVPGSGLRCRARIRSRHPEAAAVVTPLEGKRATVEFARRQSAVAPGQAVVFYSGDEVLGGGTIVRRLD